MLWHRLASVALILSLAWEPPYAVRAALKRKKKKKCDIKKEMVRSSVVAQQVKNPTSIREDVGSIPGLTQWVKELLLPQAAA